ncbi:MAG: hypothetical protein OXK76_18740 [Gammaproteobacteria bacterium]|nr:hypothetical protein [Gammaproteobacteria bacterium]
MIVLPVVVLSFVYGSEGDEVELDASLCPVDTAAIAGRTVLLLDVGKPVSDATAGLPAELVQRVTLDMAANAELQVFLIAANPLAPRILVDRLCKPYASDDLAVAAAKDRSGDTRDCDDLPAQLSRHVRNRATQFCERRDALRRRIDGIIAGDWPTTVANAYLVEAIEDTRLALAQFAHPSLFVFSDMLQHAEWYSHAERGPNKWDYEDFAQAREQETGLLSEPPPDDPDLAVTVYYVPRRGLTEHPRVARAHQRFWRRYFADVGSVTFEEQPLHVAYEVRPFAGRAAAAGSDPLAEANQEEESAASEAATALQRQPAPEPVLEVDDVETESATGSGADAGPASSVTVESAASQNVRTAGDTPDADSSLTDTAAEPVQSNADAPPIVTDRDPGGPSQPPPDKASFTDTAAEPAQSAVPPIVADSQPGRPSQPPSGNAPTDAAPAADSIGPAEDTAPLGVATGNPERLPSDNPATDAQEGVAPPPTRPEPDTLDLPNLATNSERPTDASQSFCEARLKPEFVGVDVYPLGGNTRGRKPNFGSAEIVVAYTINEDGETVDRDVAVQMSESTVDLPRYTDLFTRRAQQIVRGWSFDFASENGCERRQSRVVRLQFQYRR